MAIFQLVIDLFEMFGFVGFIIGLMITGGSEFQVEEAMFESQFTTGILVMVLSVVVIAIAIFFERIWEEWKRN